MRLPRRVPWASVADLEQLSSWIYADDSDQAKLLAISRLSAWNAITNLPHALESTLALLVVIAHDTKEYPSCSALSLRQSYATAVIRLVNGLVDPLQLGTYARSIASIAKQLGLPSWLVELRHAATHEGLPSLDLLREAARQSLSWLFHNYFLPTINPVSASSPVMPSLRPISPILKQYKNLMKIITRDASLASRYKSEISDLMKDIERWIVEAEVPANLSLGELGWEHFQSADTDLPEHDYKTRWALHRLCDGLLSEGALVPLSKRKRVLATNNFLPPPTSIALWAPLLKYLQALHVGLALVLCSRICLQLLDDMDLRESDAKQEKFQAKYDPSYMTCLSRWVTWVVDTWCTETTLEYHLRREVILILTRGIGRSFQGNVKRTSSAMDLLQNLCAGNTEIEKSVSLLLRSSSQMPLKEWQATDLVVMHQRLNSLQCVPPNECSKSTAPSVLPQQELGIYGWRILPEDWQPCPMGVYNFT